MTPPRRPPLLCLLTAALLGCASPLGSPTAPSLAIADASTGDGAPETTTHNITQVIQTVLAAQMVAKGDLLGSSEPRTDAP